MCPCTATYICDYHRREKGREEDRLAAPLRTEQEDAELIAWEREFGYPLED